MTISAASVAKRASDRFMLVRLTPARYVSDDLASAGGGIYTLDFSYPVARVERNGVTLTETPTNPPGSNDQWYHDEATNSFKVKLASAPNSTTNVVVIFYYLFYTGRKPRTTYETPTDSATTSRLWEPKIVRYPSINQSIKNALNGVLSVDSSNLELINTDASFQQYLTDDDSFSQAGIEIWIGIDDVSNIEKVASGRISGLSFTKSKVNIRILDAFSALDAPAFMGDTLNEAVYRTEAYPSLDVTKEGHAIPFIFGRSLVAFNAYIARVGTSDVNYNIDYNKSNKAVCTSSDARRLGTVNRTWRLCRTTSDGFKTLNFGTSGFNPSGSLSATGGANQLLYNGVEVSAFNMTCHSSHNLEIGDTFKLNEPTYGDSYVVVTYVAGTGIQGMVVNRTSVGPGPATCDTNTTGTLYTNQAPALSIYQPASGKTFFPCYGLDYSVTISSTAYGNKFLSITFVNNFETAGSHTGMAFLDPSRDVIAFRATQNITNTTSSPDTHANTVEAILAGAGLVAETGSITAADSALTAYCSFTIPHSDESTYSPYRKYLEDIARSTLGYVKMNGDGTVDYSLLSAPASGTEQSTHVVLKDSVKVDVGYSDIVTEIRATNPHYQTDFTSSALTVASTKAKWLHKIDKKIEFKHVLRDISGRLSTLLALLSNRKAVYSFGNAVASITSDVSDNITLTVEPILGGSGTANLRLITVDRSPDSTSLQATDLLGL
jgi:hypothetical protein